ALERAAGAGLQRREHRRDALLDAVQRAARGLREGRGDQDQRDADQDHQHGAAPPDVLAVHRSTSGGYPVATRRRWEFRLIRWITSNSSSERPDPTATQVSGDSVTWAGIWHSSRRRWSMPWSS